LSSVAVLKYRASIEPVAKKLTLGACEPLEVGVGVAAEPEAADELGLLPPKHPTVASITARPTRPKRATRSGALLRRP
jgi:hypothetical protein